MGQRVQSDQIVLDARKRAIGNAPRQEYETLMTLIDDKLKRPGHIQLASVSGVDSIVQIFSSPLQKLGGNTDQSVSGVNSEIIAGISNTFRSYPESFIDLSNGNVSGGINTDAVPTSTTDGYWRWLLLTATDNEDKYATIFGDEVSGMPDFGSEMPEVPAGHSELGFVRIQNSGGGQWNFVRPSESDFFIVAKGGGSSSGGVVDGEVDVITGVSGTTITFNETYRYGKDTGFYRNGLRMRLVDSFTSGVDNYADEYIEVNNGNDSNQITLHLDHPATTDEWFMLELAKATGSVVVANYSRIYADGTSGYQANVTTPGGNTQVNITGWADTADKLPEYGFSGIWVVVNGQIIERDSTGSGSDTYYTEVTSSGSITGFLFNKDLTNGGVANPEIQIIYFMAQSDINLLNLDSDIVPDEDNTRSIGSSSKQIKEVRTKTLYLDGQEIAPVVCVLEGDESTSMTVANTATELVTVLDAAYDTVSGWDESNNKYVVQTGYAGYYRIKLDLVFEEDADGDLYHIILRIRKNGAVIAEKTWQGAGAFFYTRDVDKTTYLADSDEITFEVYQRNTDGDTLTVDPEFEKTYASLVRIM